MAVPTSLDLHGVWGSSATDIWVVGSDSSSNPSGVILHYDGAKWSDVSPANTPGLRAVHGSAATNVWACGSGKNAHRFDGTQWSAVDTGNLEQKQDVRAFAPGDVWIATNGSMLRFDGNAWTLGPNTPTLGALGMWGSSSTDLWAIDSSLVVKDTVAHYDGNSWTPVPPGSISVPDAIWGRSTGTPSIWLAGAPGSGMPIVFRHTKAGWSKLASQLAVKKRIEAGWVFADDDVWVVGAAGLVAHYDGKSWVTVQTPATPATTMRGLWGATAKDLWAVGDGGTVVRYTAP